jgi:hypothetical protein
MKMLHINIQGYNLNLSSHITQFSDKMGMYDFKQKCYGE